MNSAGLDHRSVDPVYITSLGLVCSLGTNAETAWTALVDGQIGIQPITAFDGSAFATKVAAQILSDTIPDGPASLRRSARLLLLAVEEACGNEPRRGQGGIAAGVSANYMPPADMARHARARRGPDVDFDALSAEGADFHARARRRDAHAPVRHAADSLQLAGPRTAVDTACSSGLLAIADGLRQLRTLRADWMLAGGTYSVNNPIGILAFECLGALTRQADPALASRPFDRERDGFVMGEAAAVLVLETEAGLRSSEAQPLARVAGLGMSLGGSTLTAPSENGAAEARAMQLAMEQAGWTAESVDAVFAHGTSTPLNDVCETQAIRAVLGAHADRVPVSSNKGQIGHTVCAAGACSAVFATLALRDQIVPLTAGLRNADPACDLDYVPAQSRPANLRRVLVNAFGFGGQNACLALEAV